MLWFKAFHIIAMVAWFAGIFYLPRLFVYHAECRDAISESRFKIMERRLYYGITWPAGILTTLLGLSLISFQPDYYLKAGWMHAKILLVILLWIYHLFCGKYRKAFASGQNQKTALYFRVFNEVPTVLLILIVLLVVIRPF